MSIPSLLYPPPTSLLSKLATLKGIVIVLLQHAPLLSFVMLQLPLLLSMLLKSQGSHPYIIGDVLLNPLQNFGETYHLPLLLQLQTKLT